MGDLYDVFVVKTELQVVMFDEYDYDRKTLSDLYLKACMLVDSNKSMAIKYIDSSDGGQVVNLSGFVKFVNAKHNRNGDVIRLKIAFRKDITIWDD